MITIRIIGIVPCFVCLGMAAHGYDLMTGKGIGMGHTLVLTAPSATTQVNLPTAAFAPSGWHIEGGYNRRFELSDLDQLFLAGAARVRSFTFALGVSQFGKTDLYAEQTIKASVTFHYRHVSFGPTFSGMQLQIGDGYGDLRAATVGGGISVAWRRVALGLSADNLTRPSLADESLPTEPVYALYSELQGHGAYTVNGSIAWEKRQDPRYGIGQTIRLTERGTFFWGVAFNPLEYGGGIEIGLGNGKIAYATSVHPVLGFSHTVSFSYGSPVKRQPNGQEEF